MADKQVSAELKVGVAGRESITGLADDLDNVAKVLTGDLAKSAQGAAARLRELADQDAAISNFLKLQEQARDAGRALKAAETEAANYGRQIAAMGPPTAQEAAAQQRLQAGVNEARVALQQQEQALSGAQAQLQRFGVSGQNARDAQQRLRAEVATVRDAVQDLAPAYNSAASGASTAGATMVRTHRQIGDGVESISQQLARLQKLYAALQGIQGLKTMALELAATADQVNNLQGRMRLVTGEGDNFIRSWQGVTEVALRTHSALEETGVLFTRLAQAGKDAGLNTAAAIQQSLALTETINQSIQLSGASAEASKASVTQLVQGLQAGVLRGDEFNSIMEQSPRLARALADGLKVNTGELRKMAEAGLLTSETVIGALKGQSETVAAEFGKLPPTVGRALQDLSTQWSLYVAETDKSTGASAAAASAISAVANNLRTIGGLLMDAGQAVAAFTALRLAQHFLGIGAAAQASATATAASTAATVANTTATTANAAAKVANTAATTANAAANTAAAVSTNRFAGAFSGLGAQVRATSGAAATATATAGRFAALLGGIQTFALVTIVSNFKDIGTWIGEATAKLMGYKDRSEELARAAQIEAQIAKEAAADRARLSAAIQAAIEKQFALTKAARAAVAEFQQLTKEGTLAAEAVKKVTDNFDLGKVQGVKDFTATLDKLVADGRLGAGEFEAAWAQALNGKDLAQFEASARTAFGATVDAAKKAAEDVRRAIADGVTGKPLEDLQAVAALALGSMGRDGERVAQVMDALLRESVKRTGLEFEVLQGRIGAASRSSINDLEVIIGGLDRLKEQGVDVGRVLNASISKAIDTADSQAALDAVRAQIERVRSTLGDRVADGLLDQAAAKAQELKDKLDQAKGGINSVAEAMEKLGMRSLDSLKRTADESVKAYDVIKQAGIQEGESYVAWQLRKQEAARVMVQRMIEANGGVANAATRARAAAEGLDLATDASGKTIVRSMSDAKRAVDEVGDAAGRASGDFRAMGQSAEQAAEQAKKLQEIYDRNRLSSSEDSNKAIQDARDTHTGNVAVQQEYIDAQVARLFGENMVGNKKAEEVYQLGVRTEQYFKYGGPTSPEGFAEANAVKKAYERAKAELEAMMAEESQGKKDPTEEARQGSGRRRSKRTDGGSGSASGMSTDSGSGSGASSGTGGPTYVSNITLPNGRQVRLNHADQQSQSATEELLRELLAGKGVYQ